ncbi:cytochrome P450 71D8-like [Papaver somniferum]|uniref:cytochrome P450 71D8-like n=1 Tax=Papaver somniferum TaxID=3469 RepID=UPI000E6FBE8F|nr:cytochrome P450 71D8-like [Papaver somniferum]
MKHGPLMHLQLGEISAIVVSSPGMAEQIMKKHDANFASRGELLAAEIVTYGYIDVGFAPYGDYWRQLRKIFSLELLIESIIEEHRETRSSKVIKNGSTSTDDHQLEGDLLDVLLRIQETGGGFEFPIATDNIKAVFMSVKWSNA